MRSVCIALTLMAPIAAGAQQPTKEYLSFGGKISCGQWLDDRNANTWHRIDDEAWVMGFLSGMNAAMSVVAPALSRAGIDSDAPGMNRWLDNYCRLHPLTNLGEAASDLWGTLNKISN
jgi:hypothetical protein